jgi:hypothetical protein
MPGDWGRVMGKAKFRVLTPLVVLFLLLVVFIVLMRWSGLSSPRRSTTEIPSSKESRRSRAGDRTRREKQAGQQEIGNSSSNSGEAIGVTCDSEYFAQWEKPEAGSCTFVLKGAYELPDPRCTPGGIDPSVTVETLRDPRWRTEYIRNCETSENYKHVEYTWYNVEKPEVNTGDDQICELDHLVPLELGGADGMGNIWPECGPNAVVLDERHFKIKDRVENYLANEVRAGRLSLNDAQRGISQDWTQYLEAANRYCGEGGRCGTRHPAGRH